MQSDPFPFECYVGRYAELQATEALAAEQESVVGNRAIQPDGEIVEIAGTRYVRLHYVEDSYVVLRLSA
jgi:hypothetical protein